MSYIQANPQEPGSHHLTRENIAYTIRFLEEIESGEKSVDDIDWRTESGIIALQFRWLLSHQDDA